MTHTNMFDPLLDPACRPLPRPAYVQWNARWIWFPGQLSAHLHAKAIRASAQRCVYIGYPGNYRQPEHQAWFRYRTEIERPEALRWQTPPGRARVFVNGHALDFTARAVTLKPGPVELMIGLDFCGSLPCLLLEGQLVRSDERWEASLDGVQWAAVETDPGMVEPDLLPDADRELTVSIPPHTVNGDTPGAYHSGILLAPHHDLIVDFAHIELGRLCFEVEGNAEIRVQVGESQLEVLDLNPTFAEQRALPPIVSTTARRAVQLPERCLRFARLSASAPCTITDVRFEARVAPMEYRGSFACSDPQLNAIWQAGAATIHACTHDFFLDGLRRDGLPWADQLIEAEGADCVFFDTAAARHSLLALTLPHEPTPADLGIIDHPLFVPLSFHHDLMMRGTPEFTRTYLHRLRDLLDLYYHLQDSDGLLTARRVQEHAPQRDANWNFFPDWAYDDCIGPDTLGTPTYTQILLMRCFEVGAAIEQAYGQAERAATYRRQAELLRQTIRQRFWDEERGVFYNGLDRHGALDRRLSSHAQVWGILCDLIAPDAYQGVFDQVLNNQRHRTGNISLNQHWEFQASVKAGQLKTALATLRRAWGGWLAQGHRRFPEDLRSADAEAASLQFYGRPFGNSLCHGWAGAAAVSLLSRGVLGITPTSPGYHTCHVTPQLTDLAWVRGAMPTPHGLISLEWDGVEGTIEVPDQVTVELVGCATADGAQHVTGPGMVTLIRVETLEERR